MLEGKRRHRKEDSPIVQTNFGAVPAGLMPFERTPDVSNISLDRGVLFVVFSLLLLGATMVYSASISLADSPRFNISTEFFLNRHLISMTLALIASFIVFQFPMRFWMKTAPFIFIGAIFLLMAVLIPGIGKSVNGAYRWIPLGIMNLQATEVMKVAALLYAANFTVRKQNYMHSFARGFLPMGVVIAMIGALVLAEPDLGAFIMIVAISMGILFLGGVNYKIFVGMICVLVLTFIAMIVTSPWRMARVFAYMDPWSSSNALGKAYQLSHSLIAFGRGEWFGVGLGDAIEKQHYLPEAHTDFILAIVGEELGFVGVICVLVLFYWLVKRAFEIGRQAIVLQQFFSGLVAQGIAIWLGVQTFINVGVASGLLPTKGLTLPFMSFGGSALIATLCAIAILLRVDYENKIIMRGGRT